jgi:undecaprenyl-diphosphatase
MTLDTQVFYLLNNLAEQSPFFDGIIVFLATYLAYITVVLFLVFILVSQYPRRGKLEILLVTGISSAVTSFVLTPLIRFFYHHPRPFMVLPVHQLIIDNAWSFPSRHAAFFFAMATAVYLYNKKWGIGFFIIAILITAGRVAAGVHYPSDIVGGVLIGVIVAYITFRIARRISTPRVVENTHGSDS